MKRILPLVFLLFSLGCTTSQATVAVNDARALLTVAHDTITEHCVPAYEKAKTAEDIAAADKVCVPAGKAYKVARAAWMAAVAAVLAAQAGGDTAALVAAWQRMAEASIALAAAVTEVSR